MQVEAPGRLQPNGTKGPGHGPREAAEGRGTEAGAKQAKGGGPPTPGPQGEGQGPPGGLVGQLLIEIHPEPQRRHHQQLGQAGQQEAQGAPIGEQQGRNHQQARHLPINGEQPHHGAIAPERGPDQQHQGQAEAEHRRQAIVQPHQAAIEQILHGRGSGFRHYPWPGASLGSSRVRPWLAPPPSPGCPEDFALARSCRAGDRRSECRLTVLGLAGPHTANPKPPDPHQASHWLGAPGGQTNGCGGPPRRPAAARPFPTMCPSRGQPPR